jgi:hypothetical protein
MSVNIKLPGGSADTATLQAEIDATQSGAGLGSSGAYTPPAGSNYLSAATSLNNADSLLDAQIKAVSDEVDALSGLTSNIEYVNDGVNDVQAGIDAATDDNTLVWCSPGSYGGATVTLTDKNLIKVRAEGCGTGAFGIAELVSRGLTISGASSTRNLVQGFQVEGLTSVNGTQGRHAFVDCQLVGGITVTNGAANFVTFRDCDIAGTVTIAASVTAVVYFINCNFAAGASIANSALASQVIVANCGGFPAAAITSVTMAGQSGLSDGSFRGFFSALSLPAALTFTGNTNQLTNGAGFITAASAPVTSVNTLTGAVTISGQNANTNHTAANYTSAGATLTQHLAGVDTALGARALSSSLATVATTGAYSDLSGKPTLGTAAALNVGTGALNVVQLDASAKLPAVDGSQLTNLPSAPVTSVNTLTGAVTISGQNANTNHTAANYTSAGTTLTQHLAGVDTALGARALSSSLATVATTGAYSDLSGKPTLGTAAALDVGTGALNVVQLDASAKLPAVDGSQLTNVVAVSAVYESKSANFGAAVGYHYSVSAASGNVTATLPARSGVANGQRITFKLYDATNNLVLTPAGADTIDGLSGYTLTNTKQSITLVKGAQDWEIV